MYCEYFIYPSIIKGGYLDFSHLSELKTVNITEIYTKKTGPTNCRNTIKTPKYPYFLAI